MSEEMIIRHCSPTLAGLKTANMFACPYTEEGQLRDQLRSWNRQLRGKGLRVLPLRIQGDRALIYVYRPDRLFRDLQNGTACQLLQACGYCDSGVCPAQNTGKCVRHLIARLSEEEEFPHEIGLFLGYPPEDVCGFIEKRDCKYSGVWKVYGDVEDAKKKFARYKKCTDAYCAQYAQGKPLERLAVAG